MFDRYCGGGGSQKCEFPLLTPIVAKCFSKKKNKNRNRLRYHHSLLLIELWKFLAVSQINLSKYKNIIAAIVFVIAAFFFFVGITTVLLTKSSPNLDRLSCRALHFVSFHITFLHNKNNTYIAMDFWWCIRRSRFVADEI